MSTASISDTVTGSSFPVSTIHEHGKSAVASETHDASLLRVLHVINGEHYAGAERVQDLLAARLPEFGVEVGFVCIKPGRFASARKTQQSPLFDVPMRNKFDVSVGWKIAEIARRGSYHMIHAHTARSALVARLASWRTGLPLVYHVHSPTARDTTNVVRNWMNVGMERFSLSGVSQLITVSESLGRHMRTQGYGAEKISVVHNGVPAFASLPPRSVPQGEWTLGTVALMRPRKGIEVLVDALAMLRDQQLPVRLRAVGPFETPEYEATLKNRVTQLGLDDFVDWPGFTRDVNSELAKMDLFVLPSLFGEGLPMVVLEAMTAGVPVVSTDVEGIPEAIRPGVDGAIARPNDAADLAAQIARILRGELCWSALRAHAFARHAEKFSDRAMAAGVAAAYRKVAAARV